MTHYVILKANKAHKHSVQKSHTTVDLYKEDKFTFALFNACKQTNF